MDIVPAPATAADTIKFLEQTLRRRRLREQYLPPDLLGEPGWDMMLDLYLNRLRQWNISIGSLCIASAAPATTALRWVAKLERAGLVARRPMPLDRRVWLVTMTDRGAAMMEQWVHHALRAR